MKLSSSIVVSFIAGVFGFVLCATETPLAAQPKKDALTVVDASGKEYKVSGWKFTTGTRHLNWLATDEEKKAAKNPAAAGPEVFEFSEGKVPPLKHRVLTWVPLKHIRSIEYDHKMHTVTLKVAKTADTNVELQGQMGYISVNTLSIEAEEDLGELGKAEVKFLGGGAKGVKSISFPAPIPLEALPKGRPAQVITTDKNNKSFSVVNLQPLYQQVGKGLYLEPSLSFQKTVRIELDKIEQLTHVGEESAKDGPVFDVKLKSGTQKPLELIEHRTTADKKTENLSGLLGRVEVGYKLVPMSTLDQVVFDKMGEAAPPEKE